MLSKFDKIRGYRFFQVKAYFDKGFGFLNYLKYLIFLLGMDGAFKGNTKFIIILIAGYAVLCFIIGFIFYHCGLIEAENEVGNRYNLFQQEVRKAINTNSVNRKT